MIETILKRKSIRSFNTKPVEPEKIDTLLRAAMSAPSAPGDRPFHYIVVTDSETKQKFMEQQQHSSFLETAPLLLVVCGNQTSGMPNNFYMQSYGAATENILLAAVELGLGACWVGLAGKEEDMDFFRGLFNLPDDFLTYGGIAIGYTDVSDTAVDTYDAGKIHKEQW